MIDEEVRLCPICGKDNNCMHNKDCWCVEREIPKELIERVSVEKRGKVCICESCVDEFEQLNN